ncbi:MAG: D-alanyl-D-alanine carboxypeptidase [Pelagibacteraceae bacterium TMED216]|nr:MAG: D-alanyl-D-alanine carboxypeptidase [Pelagibacteraceae bacterium TMED216]|tara:strand:+ start:323 stop:1471 length:1149 start_codon:yes stop_codon:yes gene_type:complete
MIKFIVFLLYLFLKINFVNAAPEINAKTSILIDYNSDEILYENEPDLKIYPASMTKIMTSIIAFDLLKKNEISLDDKYLISRKAWKMSQSGYSSMFIMVNDEVSVEDLLKGIIIVSGNDSCIALAEGIAGTEENFVYMMNEKAAEIGMENTNFANSSGINDPDNYSTARDIALMSKYLIKNFPNYYKLFAEKSFTWDRTGGDPITQSNRNRLLYRNIGVDGIKTGYLAVEKYSLASSMQKGTRRLISVISGIDTKQKRTNTSLKLLNWGYRNTDTFEISKANETPFKIKAWLGKTKTIDGITKDDVYVTLSKRDSRKLKVFIDYNGPIVAPIKKDQEIAKLKIFKDQELLKEITIYSSQDLKKVNFIMSIFNSLNYLIWGDV